MRHAGRQQTKAAFLIVGVLFALLRPAPGQWVRVGGPSGIGVTDIAVSGPNLAALFEEKLFLSAPGGTSWTPAGAGMPPETWISCLKTKGPDLYVGTSKGIFISKDNGAS